MANGVFPPNLTTDVGLVRVLIPDLSTADDTVNTNYLFSDDELEALVGLYSGSVRRAAAAALDALAVNEALTYRYLRTDDLAVDGSKGAEVLRKRAAGLRAEADADDTLALEEAFQVVYPEYSGGFIPEGTPPIWGRQYGVGRWG